MSKSSQSYHNIRRVPSMPRLLFHIAFLITSLFVSSNTAVAYPNYISYGYQSCAACHFHPLGNGPLTDYGRTVAATAISARHFWKEDKTEEDIAAFSGFFFKDPTIDWLRPSLSYRDLWLSRDLTGEEVKNSYIPMDVSGTLVAKFGERDNLLFVGEMGYLPKPAGQASPSGKRYVSRQHYVGYKVNKHFGIYAGLMDKAFGIKVAEHIAYSRVMTGNTQNDQTHGVLLHFLTSVVEIGLQPFIGNLDQDKKIRQQGISSTLEFSTSESSRSGASFSLGKSETAKALNAALHSRIGFGSGSSLLAEIGQAKRTALASNISATSKYGLLQGHYGIARGWFATLMLETMASDQVAGVNNYRIGPGIQFFPFQRLELRCDLYDDVSTVKGGKTSSSWTMASQMHWWL